MRDGSGNLMIAVKLPKRHVITIRDQTRCYVSATTIDRQNMIVCAV